ncbi:glycoside hydrolase family 88 protein [Paenibacillus sinensis]|nr:glycoside hydrolase family 88 protein [Paenibacillus sinensis]
MNGVFDDMSEKDICWWTNGFWGGMMWQIYNATGDSLYKQIAVDNERKLDENLMKDKGMDHDSGFKWLPTAVANYRLTGNEESRNRGLLAANNLAGRFNPAGRFIRAWNDNGDGSTAGWAIIDCMMNLPLLYWAYAQTKDPRFLQIATMHADTAEKFFVRGDGSVNHIMEFDPVTGEVVRAFGGQGYEEGSSWTRGQAWAIYGFVLSYIHTQKEEYLNTAKRIANYYIANIPDNGFIPVDFRQPRESMLEDSTAAAIAACGLLEIEKAVMEEEKHVYYKAALKLLKTLANERCNWDEDIDYILEKCTAAYHDDKHEFSIIYGDYYFIEAIWKLTGKEVFIW